MSLPSYSEPPPPLPCYSNLPLHGETTVAFTPRGNVHSLTISENLIKSCSFMTVIFKGQNPAEVFPTYGRGSTIHGEVELEANASVSRVTVQLKGRLSVSTFDAGSLTIPVVSESAVLWSQDPTRCDLCPSVLPMAIRFPKTFTHSELSRPIPPSFSQAYYQHPAVTAQCSYALKFTLHSRASKIAFWKPTRSYSILVNYIPRTRPLRPIVHIDRFLSSLKEIPEDWLQIESTMRVRNARSAKDVQPVSCRFFIPSVGAFGLSDSIPFHIQLSSSLASLRLLLPDERPESSSVRVCLTRQMMVEINTKCTRTQVLAEGKVRTLAPPADAIYSDDHDVYVDFEGEVQCQSTRKEVRYGGFNSGTVVVKDYIVFSVQSANPKTSPLLNHQYSQPIRLVTDTWTDDSTSHPSDI